MPKLKISKKLNMQPGDGADYEAEARAYFESLRQPFDQTVEATQSYSTLPLLIGTVILLLGVLATPLISHRIAAFFFHQSVYTLLGKSFELTDIVMVFSVCCLIIFMLALLVQLGFRIKEFHRATKPLSQRLMVFALSYAIVRELDSLQRTNLPHHQQTAITFLAKLLTYLRWILQGMNPDDMHFHALPSVRTYPVAPYAQRFADVLNWSETCKREYDVILALNSLHSKISPRLQNAADIPLISLIFQGLGNFFYTTVAVQSHEGQASWGYAQLLRSADIINRMSAIAEPEEKHAQFLSLTVFTHPNFAIALCAWVLVLETFVIVVLAEAFRFFPTMTMNSQSMVALITTPIAIAVAIVGISRKSS